MTVPATDPGFWAAVGDLPSLLRPSVLGELPFDEGVDWLVRDFLVPSFRPAFRAMQWPVDQVLSGLESLLLAVPFIVIAALLVLVALRVAGRGVALFTVLALCFIEWIGVWPETMTTLAMVLTAVLFCAAAGIPIGIAASRSDTFAAVLRPILDIMQTIPPFVYLVPIVMLFGIGIVPAVIATIVFALPAGVPCGGGAWGRATFVAVRGAIREFMQSVRACVYLVRIVMLCGIGIVPGVIARICFALAPVVGLANLGVRQGQEELVEAGFAFGSTSRQVLWEIQFPLALRTIMAGLNQTLMLALSMVVIAALIGAGGLGLTVFTGLGRLDVGKATVGGVGIVLIAIVLDPI